MGHGEKLRLGICVRAGVSVERLDSWSQKFQSRVSELHVSGPVMRSIMTVRKYDRGDRGGEIGGEIHLSRVCPQQPSFSRLAPLTRFYCKGSVRPLLYLELRTGGSS